MATLSEKIIKSREFEVPVEGYVFICRRPTQVEWFDEIVPGKSSGRFMPFIVGWKNVKELDMLVGGDPHPLPFDAEACREWLSDRSDLYGPIINAIRDAFDASFTKREETVKN